MNFSRRSSGFTLIEMAIVVILIGALAGAIIPRLVASIPERKAKESRNLVKQARDEIIGLALQDSEYKLVSTANFAGKIATRRDAWGQPLQYVIAADADTGNTLDSISPCKVEHTTLSVVTPGGNRVNDIAYIVYSTGPNTADDANMVTTSGNNEFRHQSLGSASITTGREYDEIVEYVTLDYLDNTFVCDEYTPPDTNINQNDDFGDFASVVSTNDIGARKITGSEGQYFLLGFTDEEHSDHINTTSNYTYGCVWYGGSNGNCTLGDCGLENGVRAYFSFTINNPTTGTMADGFAFGIISADSNELSDGPCGGRGSALGWASGNYSPADRGDPPFVDAPKIGVEFDSYPSGAYSDPSGNDHMAIIYWARQSAGTDLEKGEDDNTHGTGPTTNTTGGHSNPDSTGGDSGFLNFNTGTFWNEDGTVTYHVRLDIDRTTLPGDRGQYDTKVWFASGVLPNNFDDVSQDIDFTGVAGVETLSDTIIMTSAYHSLMDKVIIGWTEGTGASRQQIRIHDFKATFH